MTQGETDAAELLDAVGRHSQDAVLLAQVVSLAARIEPELLREARLKLLPEADAGVEADLWFSPLVQSATPLALVLLPEVAGLLRQRLAQSGKLLTQSWKLLQRVHRDAPAAIKLEEEVTWMALSGGADSEQLIEGKLMSVVSAIVNQNRAGLARWALRALPRLPDAARRTKGATMLALASAARLGSWQLLGDQARDKNMRPGTLSQLRVLLPPDLPQVSVGVRLFEDENGDGARAGKRGDASLGVEFSSPPAPGAGSLTIEVPATTPLLLEVSSGAGPHRAFRHVSLYQGQTETIEVLVEDIEVYGLEITVRTARGDVYTLRRAEEAAARPASEDPSGAGRTAHASPIPRPPAFGFVSRRDPQGRDIVERLKEELAPGVGRLVTLSGPGGIGKTTLAAEAARALQAAYKNRVVWSSAEGLPDFTLLALLDDIATQLGEPRLRTLAPGAKAEQVRALVANDPTLVVLDSYQAVAEAEQKRIEDWFRAARCSALFTSRARVADTVFVPVAAMSGVEAGEFFEKLTGHVQDLHRFTPAVRGRVYETAEGNPYVMQWVVAQLDLATEPEAVLAELAQGEGDAAERLFERSFNLSQLGDDGRDTLLALSLFTPSASREALTAVAGIDDEEQVERLDAAVKHLRALWLVKGLDDNRRLALEGLTRSMAAARLSKDPRAGEFRSRFVAYFLRYARQRREPTPENFDALEEEFDNLMCAADSAFRSTDWEDVVGLCDAFSVFLDTRGYWDEALRRSEQGQAAALNAGIAEPRPTQFAETAANILLRRGEYDAAKRAFHSVLDRYRQIKHEPGIERSLRFLGNIALEQDELAEARKLYTQSLEISRKLADPSSIAANLHNLAVVHQSIGDLKRARSLYQEALVLSRRLNDQASVATTTHQLGVAAAEAGDTSAALGFYRDSLRINQTLGAQEAVASSLHQLGRLALQGGETKEAERYLYEALTIFDALGSPAAEDARRDLAMLDSLAPAPRPAQGKSKSVSAKKATKKASKSSKASAGKSSRSGTTKAKTTKAKAKSLGVKGARGTAGGVRMGGKGGSAKGSVKGRTRTGGKRGGFSGRSSRRLK